MHTGYAQCRLLKEMSEANYLWQKGRCYLGMHGYMQGLIEPGKRKRKVSLRKTGHGLILVAQKTGPPILTLQPPPTLRSPTSSSGQVGGCEGKEVQSDNQVTKRE